MNFGFIYSWDFTACSPHSFLLWSSHHHLPARKSSPSCTALVQGWQPILGNPLSCSTLYGICCSLQYCFTSSNVQSNKGWILMISLISSYSTKSMSCLFADCSARIPVTQIFLPLIARCSGSIFRILQHSFRFSTDS